MRPINASDADNATKHERNWETAREGRLPFRFAEGQPCAVDEQDNVLGQQKVNNVAPERPKLRELTWLNHALRAAFRRTLRETGIHS